MHKLHLYICKQLIYYKACTQCLVEVLVLSPDFTILPNGFSFSSTDSIASICLLRKASCNTCCKTVGRVSVLQNGRSAAAELGSELALMNACSAGGYRRRHSVSHINMQWVS